MKSVQTVVFFSICVNLCDFCWGKQTECVPYTPRKKNVPTLPYILASGDEDIDAFESVKFLLFTSKNRDCTQELILNDIKSVLYSNFASFMPTRVIIHGWKSDERSEMVHLIKEAFLARGRYNVIVTNWSYIAKDFNYEEVRRYVSDVGFVLSKFLEFLNKMCGVSYNNIYLIGHSLGAHIAGVAGYHLKRKISAIFALDPAEPGFKNVPAEYRVDSSDAKYVEGIHTDAGFLGFTDPVGHADFYPNYGKGQLGCSRFVTTCSHCRAYEYFAEAINSTVGFWARQCTAVNEILSGKCSFIGDYVRMAEDPAVPKKGLFYLPTKFSSPFAMGKMIIEVQLQNT